MLGRAALIGFCTAALASAGLLRIEVLERSDVLDGMSFGLTGPYERIVGRAYFGLDPNAAANRIVADLDKAPRNEDGLVECSADIYVLKPRDPARGNGAVLYEVTNRGRKSMLSMFNHAAVTLDPRAPRDFGDGLLLQQGYMLLWLGWQFDVPRDPALMRLYTPVAHGVTGPVRAEVTLDAPAASASVADRGHIPYLVANPDDPGLTLTVRDRAEGPRQPLPRGDWSLRDRSVIVMRSGFQPGRIYELVYSAQDSPLVGMGPAAVRDTISFLKNGGNGVTVLSDHRRYIKRAYAFGVSQSGRFLRTFVYYGFNADEKGRKVFDGMLSHVAGAGRGSFNNRFAQPSRDGHPFFNLLYPTDIFPFSDVEQTDPETGLRDGILTHAATPDTTPRIFYTNSSYEYYGRAASLIHTTLDGKQDAAIPPTTRIYLYAGGQHGPAAFPPGRKGTRYVTNPNPFTWSMRAMLAAMDAWVRDGKEPPASLYPRIDEDKLVPLEALRFPKIPGVVLPTRIQRAWRADYGPQFRTAGIITIEPPRLGTAFPTLVPQVDADGNETSGIRMPEIQVPLATYTGWNLRAPEIGAPEELFSMAGSFLPFPRTEAERVRAGDPRLSIQERYASRAEYLEKIGAAARKLADRGLLLDRDVQYVVARDAALWDYLMQPAVQ